MRLIDADALKELIASNVYPVADDLNSRDYGMFWTGGIEKAIDEMPSIDAVPVVRCKDCVCWDTSWKPTRAIEGAYWCSNNDIYTESDDYCSLAERKESK